MVIYTHPHVYLFHCCLFLPEVHSHVWDHFHSTWSFFNSSFGAGLRATDSHSFCLFENNIICPLFLKGIFTGYRILHWQLHIFSILRCFSIIFPFFLLIGQLSVLLLLFWSNVSLFFFNTFQIFSLVFSSFTKTCQVMCSLYLFWFEVFRGSWMYGFIFFFRYWKICRHYFFKLYASSFSLASSFGILFKKKVRPFHCISFSFFTLYFPSFFGSLCFNLDMFYQLILSSVSNMDFNKIYLLSS